MRQDGRSGIRTAFSAVLGAEKVFVVRRCSFVVRRYWELERPVRSIQLRYMRAQLRVNSLVASSSIE